jgi:hypothetical protein
MDDGPSNSVTGRAADHGRSGVADTLSHGAQSDVEATANGESTIRTMVIAVTTG